MAILNDWLSHVPVYKQHFILHTTFTQLIDEPLFQWQTFKISSLKFLGINSFTSLTYCSASINCFSLIQCCTHTSEIVTFPSCSQIISLLTVDRYQHFKWICCLHIHGRRVSQGGKMVCDIGKGGGMKNSEWNSGNTDGPEKSAHVGSILMLYISSTFAKHRPKIYCPFFWGRHLIKDIILILCMPLHLVQAHVTYKYNSNITKD